MILLHDIAVVFPQPPYPGAGIPGLFQIITPYPEYRDYFDKLFTPFQVIGGGQIFFLFAPQGWRQGTNGLLVEDQVAFGMEFHLQACLKDDIEGIEKIGLDLVGIRYHAPYPAKKRIGLQRIDFLWDDLGGGAAKIMVADPHVILFFPDHGIAVDDLLAQGDVRIVGVEILRPDSLPDSC